MYNEKTHSKNRQMEQKQTIATFVDRNNCNMSPKKAKAYRWDPHLQIMLVNSY